jgi:hypothetical protein
MRFFCGGGQRKLFFLMKITNRSQAANPQRWMLQNPGRIFCRSAIEPSLTIQKLGRIELFSIRLKKKNAKAAKIAKPPSRCVFF